jgi:hypothetical protein
VPFAVARLVGLQVRHGHLRLNIQQQALLRRRSRSSSPASVATIGNAADAHPRDCACLRNSADPLASRHIRSVSGPVTPGYRGRGSAVRGGTSRNDAVGCVGNRKAADVPPLSISGPARPAEGPPEVDEPLASRVTRGSQASLPWPCGQRLAFTRSHLLRGTGKMSGRDASRMG